MVPGSQIWCLACLGQVSGSINPYLTLPGQAQKPSSGNFGYSQALAVSQGLEDGSGLLPRYQVLRLYASTGATWTLAVRFKGRPAGVTAALMSFALRGFPPSATVSVTVIVAVHFTLCCFAMCIQGSLPLCFSG